jgi:hypothetical protein
MSKTVQKVKNSLKFKASEKDGLLTVRYGVKKFTLPVKARMMCDGKFMFLSFGSSSELYRVGEEGLTAMDRNEDASAAYEALNTTKRRGRPKKVAEASITPELEKALKGIPAGHRLVYNPDGTIKLVKTRTRKKKGS